MGEERSSVTRRAVLSATGGSLAAPIVSGRAGAATGDPAWGRCPDATIEPSHGHCPGAADDACADDHPETEALRNEVADVLAERYPTVGALLDAGFTPYFDVLEREDGWSHWLNPTYIGDDAVLDPERPESVLVDNETWRAIGVMFIATRDGDPIETPPAVYELDGGAETEADAADGAATAEDAPTAGESESGGRCSPWHYHAGLPGRFAWWYYRRVYEGDAAAGDVEFPCRTPCMLHVWTVEHPEGVYAHDAPPREYRDVEPATETGFDTDAEPGEDELAWGVLPDDAVPDERPAALARRSF